MRTSMGHFLGLARGYSREGVLQGNLHSATGEGARSWGVDAPVLQRQFYGLPEWWVGSSSGVSFTAVPEDIRFNRKDEGALA